MEAIVNLTPDQIVSELDKNIVGQKSAKRAVAVALRNRWRRQQVSEPLCSEIKPKNILLIGPTGVGKTEIVRRLARLSQAPFIKVEATKFTEVGYVGRDVDTIIRDLMEMAIQQVREREKQKVEAQAKQAAQERILAIIFPSSGNTDMSNKLDMSHTNEEKVITEASDTPAKQKLRQRLVDGLLDEKEIEIKLSPQASSVEFLMPSGMEEAASHLQSLFSNLSSSHKEIRRLTVKEAMRCLINEEAEKLVDESSIKLQAVKLVEQNGIVFLDEIDKLTSREPGHGPDISRQGVQRDLLPLLEGSSVNTRYGVVRTDHVLFIASGAFHLSRPSDLIPELQGRLPIRVNLDSLSADDFFSILHNTNASLISQYKALMEVDNIQLSFTREGVQRIAEIAFRVNEKTENIGARRLFTIMEKLLEEISFSAPSLAPKEVVIDVEFVEKNLQTLSLNEDLSRYIL